MSNLSSLRLLESYLEDLAELSDESNRLKQLDLSFEHNDREIRKSLQKIAKFLQRNDDGDDYDELVEQYNELRSGIETIDTSEYIYHRKVTPRRIEHKKSVRFNDTLDFEPNQVQSQGFKPFKDSGDDSEALFEGRAEDDTASINSSSNQELFIQHQQQLLEQDSHLDSLADSVRRQHGLSVHIHTELEDQNIMLDDMEAQLDSSDRRLKRGHKRLDYFGQKAKENGQWLTILALVVILVLLLVILK